MLTSTSANPQNTMIFEESTNPPSYVSSDERNGTTSLNIYIYILQRLVVTPENCFREGQSDCDQWHEARRLRITGSKCEQILLQKQKIEALLQFCLYPKPFLFDPKPIAWGKQNEVKAQ